MDVDERWRRLGRIIEAERTKRWRTRREFARASGVGVRTLQDLETGSRQRFREATLTAVEMTLGWEVGSCERIVKGGQPLPARGLGLDELADDWRRLPPDARDLITALIRGVARGGW